MTQENFVYWLNGFLEISDAKKLNEKQVQIIKDHLALVFEKVTPDYGDFSLSSSSTANLKNITNTFTSESIVKDSKAWDLGTDTNYGNKAICETPKHLRGFTKKGPTIYC